MLGEKIAEERGTTTGQRILPHEGPGFKIESSFRSVGKTLGIDGNNRGTFVSVTGPGGILHGRGQGVLMTQDGGMATWEGLGIGTPGQDGSLSFRGVVTFQTQSETLARLNTVAGAFEHDIDAEGNSTTQTWEWK